MFLSRSQFACSVYSEATADLMVAFDRHFQGWIGKAEALR